MYEYVKLPVVIEAFRLGHDDPPPWASHAINIGVINHRYGKGGWLIHTLEGDMHAPLGDWIIRGVKGELYPCKHEIFIATYEPAADAVLRAAQSAVERPTVVCLCGSTRFYDAFQRANYEQTMAGRIVLTVGFYPHAQERAHGEHVGCTPAEKAALDELHLRKIDLADEVLILNVGGYIGESTARELAYARALGKPVRFLEADHA